MKKGHDKEILRLHKEGRSFREIGRLLGISHVAVRKRYLKALKVSTDVGHTPEKGSLTNQISATIENLGFQSNPECHGNLKKSELLKEANIAQVNNSGLPEDIPQHDDGNLSGNRSGNGVSVSVRARENMKPKVAAESTETPAEPQYYRHRLTGQLFRRNEIINEKIRSEVEPYVAPKYLRKTSARLIKRIRVTEKVSQKGDWTEIRTEIELHDAMDASEKLARSYGLYKDKVEITGKSYEERLRERIEERKAQGRRIAP